MLTLSADQPEGLWHDVLPVEVKELPQDLAALISRPSDDESGRQQWRSRAPA